MKRRKGGRYTPPQQRATLIPIELGCGTCGWNAEMAFDLASFTPCPEHGFDGGVFDCPACGAECELSAEQILAGMASAATSTTSRGGIE